MGPPARFDTQAFISGETNTASLINTPLDLSSLPIAENWPDKTALKAVKLIDIWPEVPELRGDIPPATNTQLASTYRNAWEKFKTGEMAWNEKGHIAERMLEERGGLQSGDLEGILRKLGQDGIDIPLAGQSGPMEIKTINNKIIVKNMPWSTGEKIAVAGTLASVVVGGTVQAIDDNSSNR